MQRTLRHVRWANEQEFAEFLRRLDYAKPRNADHAILLAERELSACCTTATWLPLSTEERTLLNYAYSSDRCDYLNRHAEPVTLVRAADMPTPSLRTWLHWLRTDYLPSVRTWWSL